MSLSTAILALVAWTHSRKASAAAPNFCTWSLEYGWLCVWRAAINIVLEGPRWGSKRTSFASNMGSAKKSRNSSSSFSIISLPSMELAAVPKRNTTRGNSSSLSKRITSAWLIPRIMPRACARVLFDFNKFFSISWVSFDTVDLTTVASLSALNNFRDFTPYNCCVLLTWLARCVILRFNKTMRQFNAIPSAFNNALRSWATAWKRSAISYFSICALTCVLYCVNIFK